MEYNTGIAKIPRYGSLAYAASQKDRQGPDPVSCLTIPPDLNRTSGPLHKPQLKNLRSNALLSVLLNRLLTPLQNNIL